MVQWEVKLGPLTVNFRVLMEPKGFLRIIVLVIALLAFAITAGFNSGAQSNSLTCLDETAMINYTTYMTFHYPYASDNFRLTPASPENISNSTVCMTDMRLKTLPLSTSAQFFIAMGVLTMIYVVAALLIYMLFITPELFMAKWLVLGDFFATIVFGVLYVIACIAWSAGAAQLNSYLVSTLEQYSISCFRCSEAGVAGVSGRVNLQAFAQLAISLIFGWLAAFIWLCSAWFVYKDTVWHKDKTGPLASLYNKARGKGTDGTDGGDGESGNKE